MTHEEAYDAVDEYFERQKKAPEAGGDKSFNEEYAELCKKHGIDLDTGMPVGEAKKMMAETYSNTA